MHLVLVVFLEVHSIVQVRDLIAVAVEHQRGALENFAESAFFRLTPTRMIDIRIYVGVKTILLRSHAIPGGRRLFTDKTDLHNGSYAFVAILPRHNDAHRGAVLI